MQEGSLGQAQKMTENAPTDVGIPTRRLSPVMRTLHGCRHEKIWNKELEGLGNKTRVLL